MDKVMFHIYEHADALAMAVRLHVSGKAPADIDYMLGKAVVDIVDMATRMLLKSSPSFIGFRDTMFSEDVQGEIVMLVFRLIANGKVDTSNPKAMLNLFVKTAQNRIRNIRRNMATRNRIAEMITESCMPTSLDSSNGMVMDVLGRKVYNTTAKKKEVKTWEK